MKQGELQQILSELSSVTRYSEVEILNMRARINSIDAAVRSQHKAIEDRRLQPNLAIYEQILELSLSELTRRENNRGHQPTESDAMRARRLRQDSLDVYASDGRGEVPLESWTVVLPAPSPGPISANDLRLALNEREEGRFRYEPTIHPLWLESNNQRMTDVHFTNRRSPPRSLSPRAGPSGQQHGPRSPRPPSPSKTNTLRLRIKRAILIEIRAILIGIRIKRYLE